MRLLQNHTFSTNQVGDLRRNSHFWQFNWETPKMASTVEQTPFRIIRVSSYRANRFESRRNPSFWASHFENWQKKITFWASHVGNSPKAELDLHGSCSAKRPPIILPNNKSPNNGQTFRNSRNQNKFPNCRQYGGGVYWLGPQSRRKEIRVSPEMTKSFVHVFILGDLGWAWCTPKVTQNEDVYEAFGDFR